MTLGRCEHGAVTACPWPRCERGVGGTRLVVPGPYEVAYFEREYDFRREFVRWREVKRVPAEPARRIACGK